MRAAVIFGLVLGSLSWAGGVRAFDLPASARASAAEEEGEPRVTLSLVSSARSVAPGEGFRVGVLFELAPEWHVYFRNPGEAGLATEIEWEVAGARVGALVWPLPRRFVDPSGQITTFGYEGEVLFWAEAQALDGAQLADEAVSLEVTADFLVCKVDCIPGRVTLSRSLEVGASAPTTDEEAALFVAAEASRPRRPDEVGLSVEVAFGREALAPSSSMRAALALVSETGSTFAAPEPMAAAFFPDRVEGLVARALGVRAHPSASGAVIDLELVAGPDRVAEAQTLGGIVQVMEEGERRAFEVSVEVPRAATLGAELESPLLADQPTEARIGSAPEAGEQVPRGAAPPFAFWLVLLFAFGGGAILNLMPCVLPVLAIKAFSLLESAGDEGGRRAPRSLAYTGGIVASMWALAGVVIGLRSAGVRVGWGFQLQEPGFVAALAVLLAMLALGFFGVYQLVPPASALATTVDARSGLPRAFGEGVLAVVLATPCSAPLLGTAVGFAFASEPWVIAAVFTMIGLGLASPFVLLVHVPAARRWIPKPGPWMHYVERALGFALLGTAVWLLWVLGRLAGVDAMARALVFTLAAAAGIFAIASSRGAGLWARRAVPLVALALVATAGFFLLRFEARTEGSSAHVGSRAWSAEVVEEELAAGRVVFVNFTADWCLTCQVNERLVLDRDGVRRAFASEEVTALVGDWTLRDEVIRAELARHGKAGVPLYLVYSPNAPNHPEVLPETLTEGRLLEALSRAGSR